MSPGRRAGRLLAATLLGGLVLLVGAPRAFAHAELLSTEPSAGAADQSPREIVLRFTEAVEITPASIRVFDADAERVDPGKADHPSGDARAVRTKLPKMDRGAYVVTWRVNSADSHPIHGAFTFRVGPAQGGDGADALAKELLSADGGSSVVGGLYAIVRLVAYASLVTLVGGFALLLVAWPAGAAVSRVRRILTAAWAGATMATLAGVAVYGAYAGGLGVSAIVSPSVFTGTLGIRFGRLWGGRLLLLLLIAPLARLLLDRMRASGRRPSPAVVGAALVSGSLLFLATAAVGHASTGSLPVLGVSSNLVHLSAVSAWLGGLVLLSFALLPRSDAAEMARVVPLFSRLAFWAVTVILATGTYQSWREVRTLEALTNTAYGRLLALKVLFYAAMVGFGALSRRWVRQRYLAPRMVLSHGPGTATAEPEGATVRHLRRFVAAETAVAALVLAVTSILVNMAPAKASLAQPFSADLTAGDLMITVTIDPAKVGPTTMHFYTVGTNGSTVTDVADLDANLRLPAEEIGPLDVPLQRVAPGHYSVYGFDIPIKGSWDLEVVARVSEIDRVSAKTTVPVR